MGHEAVHDAPASPLPDVPARWHGRRAPPPPVRGPAGMPCRRMGYCGISWDHLGVNEPPGRVPSAPRPTDLDGPLTGRGLKEWLRPGGAARRGGRGRNLAHGVGAVQIRARARTAIAEQRPRGRRACAIHSRWPCRVDQRIAVLASPCARIHLCFAFGASKELACCAAVDPPFSRMRAGSMLAEHASRSRVVSKGGNPFLDEQTRLEARMLKT